MIHVLVRLTNKPRPQGFYDTAPNQECSAFICFRRKAKQAWAICFVPDYAAL